MTNNLPPFSVNPTCPKCGGSSIGARWFPAIDDPPTADALHLRAFAEEERVERECKRCHYFWLEATLDATDTVDDEPDDAYLAAKLAAHTPPDAQKPASTARKAETDISYPGDRYHTVESNLERLTTCAQEARPGIGAAEPSIPVSRVVAVLAEPIITYEHLASVDSPDGRMAWPEHDRRCVALHYSLAVNLDISEALRAELARRKGTA